MVRDPKHVPVYCIIGLHLRNKGVPSCHFHLSDNRLHLQAKKGVEAVYPLEGIIIQPANEPLPPRGE